MAIVVTPDVVHPAATLVVDFTQFASLNIYNIPVYKAARVFGVTGLQDGSTQQSATALARSLVQYGIPQPLAPYGSNINAVALTYQVQPQVANSDQDVFIVVNYATIVLNPVSSNGQYTISDDSTLQGTQTQLNPNTGEPLGFAFLDAAGYQEDTATIAYDEVHRRVTALTAVSASKMEAIRAAVPSVNDATWNGLPAGYWRLDSLSQAGATTSTENPATTYVAQVTASTRTTRDWSYYVPFRDRNSGRIREIKDADSFVAKSLPYQFGVIYGNANAVPTPIGVNTGLLRVGPYRMATFSSIFPF